MSSARPPCQLEAEQQVLGALLASGTDALHIRMILRSEHFADPVHGAIFGAVVSRIADGRPIDVRGVADDVAADLAEVGGTPYLAQLALATHSAAGRAAAERVRDAWQRRCLIDVGQHLQALAAETMQGALDGPDNIPAIEQGHYLAARLRGLLLMLSDAT